MVRGLLGRYNAAVKTRRFSNTETNVSEVGLGTWQLGDGDWGAVTEDQALATLHAAADAGVTLFDTADVYGGGESERRIGEFLASRAERNNLKVATKFGRGAEPGGLKNVSFEVMKRHAEASRERLGVKKLWLLQGHCLTGEILQEGVVFDNLRRLQQEGVIKNFGMSVESVEEALLCLRIDGISSLQVIFNVFRQKLIKELFDDAKRRDVALIVRLPLASGLFSGKMKRETVFAARDHRNYNRDGQAFNVGETFAGLPFEAAVELVEELRDQVPEGYTMAQWALRYCLDFDAVTSVIPGARNEEQARANVTASELAPLSPEQHAWLAKFYTERVAGLIRGSY